MRVFSWWSKTSTFLRNYNLPFAIEVCRGKHKLPSLMHHYDSLEPVICREIMELHHKKHHKELIDNLNKSLLSLKTALANGDVRKMLELEKPLLFNGGGHINHSIYWQNYSPQSTQLDGELLQMVIQTFGSLQGLKDSLLETAKTVQGSGWVWLGFNPDTCCLIVTTTPNNMPLRYSTGLQPLLAIDVWEHAYYLQYLSNRNEYVRNLLEIINWDNVRNRFLDAKCDIHRTF